MLTEVAKASAKRRGVFMEETLRCLEPAASYREAMSQV
jgi:hypothetical protein